MLRTELIETIAARQLEASALYRIARHDVPFATLDIDNHDVRLQVCCRDHVQVVHGRRGSYVVAGVRRRSLPMGQATSRCCRGSSVRPAARRARGDEYHSMHWDSIFCFMAQRRAARKSSSTSRAVFTTSITGRRRGGHRRGSSERVAARLPIGARRAKRLAKRILARSGRRATAWTKRGVP